MMKGFTVMMKGLLLAVLLVGISAESFAGYKVVRAVLETPEQLAAVEAWSLDVWSRESTLALGENGIIISSHYHYLIIIITIISFMNETF